MDNFQRSMKAIFKKHGGSFTEEKCKKHNCQKITVNNEPVCPECKKERDAVKLTMQYRENEKSYHKRKIAAFLKTKSIVPNNLKKSLFKENFDNYFPANEEQNRNLQKASGLLDEYKDGSRANALIQGKAGRGKTHLAISILNDFNGKGLFIDLNEMLLLIKKGFNSNVRNYPYTADYFNRLVEQADLVVLDDLGTEASINRNTGMASSFVMDTLNSFMNHCGRAIITTNLTPTEIQSTYNKRLASRFFMGTKESENHIIIFNSGNDYRVGGLSFNGKS